MKGKKRRIWKSFMAFCLVLCMLFGAMPGGLQLVNPVRTEAGDSYSLIHLEIGDRIQYGAYIEQSIGEKLKWHSENISVATVENGLISAVNEGTAVITCEHEGGAFDVIRVCVYKPGKLPKGDLDCDHKVTLSDAQFALIAAIKIMPQYVIEDRMKAADIDGDGQVTLADAQIILKVALKIGKLEDYTK